MNRIVLNRLMARSGEDIDSIGYAVLIDMIQSVERGEAFTVNDLAKRNYVSPATVSRLCKKLGFGFRELRQHIADELSGFHDQRGSQRQRSGYTPQLKSLLNDNIDRTFTEIGSDLDLAVQAIRTARNIVVIGTGISQIVADYLAQRLQIIGIQAQAVRNDLPAGVFVNAADSADLIIIVSRSGESSQMLSKAAIVQRLEKDIISFGCNRESTIGKLGNPCLPISGVHIPLDQSKKITSGSITAFFLVDVIIDKLISE